MLGEVGPPTVDRGSIRGTLCKTPPLSTLLIYTKKPPYGGFSGQFKNLHRENQNTLEVAPLQVPRLTIC